MIQYIRGFWCGDHQPDCTDHPPWCGGDDNALTWGIIGLQAMVWAKTAGHHDQRKTSCEWWNKGQNWPHQSIVEVWYIPTIALTGSNQCFRTHIKLVLYEGGTLLCQIWDTYVSRNIFLASGSPVELCRLWYKIWYVSLFRQSYIGITTSIAS